MHPAPAFLERDVDLLAGYLAHQPFVTLAAAPDGRPRVAHAPVVMRRTGEGVVLDFHLARSNSLAPFLEAGFPAVIVALGPEAYVSPDWYASSDHVPTWNYLTVEAEGPAAAFGEDELVRLLDDLSAQEEARLSPKPAWTRAKMAPGRFEGLLKGIIGARLTVERLEGTFKLSQNRSPADRAGVIAALGDHPIAALMGALPEA
jgi:transcriptional regulator